MSHREMRYKKRELPKDEVIHILQSCDDGVLSVVGDDGYPYGVPLNFTYINGAIFLHGALKGHKIDSIEKNPKVSFTIVAHSRVDAKGFTTKYQSVIAFGKAEIITDVPTRKLALDSIVSKFSPDFPQEGQAFILENEKATSIIRINIEHISGKENK